MNHFNTDLGPTNQGLADVQGRVFFHILSMYGKIHSYHVKMKNTGPETEVYKPQAQIQCAKAWGHLSAFVKVSIVWLSVYLFIYICSAVEHISVLKDKCCRVGFLVVWLRLKPWIKINNGLRWQDVALSWLDVCLVFAVLIFWFVCDTSF